jgi:hypothetical protein
MMSQVCRPDPVRKDGEVQQTGVDVNVKVCPVLDRVTEDMMGSEVAAQQSRRRMKSRKA